MFSLPLLHRELKIASRTPATYRLRAVVAAVGVAVLSIALVNNPNTKGIPLFWNLHRIMMLVLAVVGVLLTADTISRERREGTLELLLLTPLTEFKLVAAKFAAQLLRLLSIWAVILPLSIVPFIVGGVSPNDVLLAGLIEAKIIGLSLVAGIFASTFVNRQLPAIVLGLILAVSFIWVDAILLSNGLFGGIRANRSIASNLVTFAICGLLLSLVAQRLKRGREKAGDSRRAAWFQAIFLTPYFWKDLLKRTLRKRMDQNPLIWLEFRTPWSRVGRYVMVGFLVVIESYALVWTEIRGIGSFHQIAAMVLLAIMALSSSTSFQREKENGAFELLLVAPFTEMSLIHGRLRAVWSYYLPVGVAFAILITLLSSLDVRSYYYHSEAAIYEGRTLSLAFSIITVPVAGLYFALRLKHLISTFLATVAVALIGPLCAWPLLLFLAQMIDRSFSGLSSVPFFPFLALPSKLVTIVLHLCLIRFFGTRIYQILRNRQFA